MNSAKKYTFRFILMDFQTSSVTATAPYVQQEMELPLSRTGLVDQSKKILFLIEAHVVVCWGTGLAHPWLKQTDRPSA